MKVEFSRPALPASSARQAASGRFFACDDPNRRDVVCGGGAAVFSLIIAGLLGTSRPVLAQSLTGSVPELDRVAVRIVTDSYQFAVAPSRKLEGLDIENFGWGIGPGRPPGKTLVSEFGLAMHVESRRGTETRQVLIDFGFTPEALNNNLTLLGVEPSALDALVLSHGHYDHFGVLDREALEKADLAVTSTPQPSLVGGHGFTSGRIGQESFEKLLSPSAMRIGFEKGAGCYAGRFTDAERAQGVIPDQFQHEIATAFNLKGRGLVILTSCSHRGVVNAARQAQAASGVSKVHAVIGGFHLAPYQPDYLRQTIAALKEMNPTYVVPLHCSGEAFFDLAKAEMPEKLVRAYTGTRLVFSSAAS
jgi:7,8-dihydropterin-6-yl-methyl-4-(beta-D-ribofuranosyl)aminobenzene 5'-phosphate synthase